MKSLIHRREFLRYSSFATAVFATPGLFAEQLVRTPTIGEGPFYPDKLPLDTDNDLLLLNDAITPAVGEITHLSGRILSQSGQPIRNAFVEIWQVDSQGVYIHSQSANGNDRDTNFQGYGRFLTDSSGQYYFRTIKPVQYPGRTPHIHFAVSKNGKRIFTTQMLIQGVTQNKRDGLFQRIEDPFQREAIQVEFKPVPDSTIGELAAEFDIVLGLTPNEDELKSINGGIGKPQRQRGPSRRDVRI